MFTGHRDGVMVDGSCGELSCVLLLVGATENSDDVNLHVGKNLSVPSFSRISCHQTLI